MPSPFPLLKIKFVYDNLEEKKSDEKGRKFGRFKQGVCLSSSSFPPSCLLWRMTDIQLVSGASEKALKLLGVDRNGCDVPSPFSTESHYSGFPICSSSVLPTFSSSSSSQTSLSSPSSSSPSSSIKTRPDYNGKAIKLLGLDPSLERATRFFGEEYHVLEGQLPRARCASPPPARSYSYRASFYHASLSKAGLLLGVDPSLEKASRLFGEEYHLLESYIQQQNLQSSSSSSSKPSSIPSSTSIRTTDERVRRLLALDPSIDKAARLLGVEYRVVEEALLGRGRPVEGPQLHKASKLLGIDDATLSQELSLLSASLRRSQSSPSLSSLH